LFEEENTPEKKKNFYIGCILETDHRFSKTILHDRKKK